jgi:hypothetical protein
MLEDGGLLASLQRPGLDAQAAIQNVMQSAVRLAFTLKLSDEASNGGGECARHPETAQELLASLTSGSGSTDDESQSLDALSPRSTSDWTDATSMWFPVKISQQPCRLDISELGGLGGLHNTATVVK